MRLLPALLACLALSACDYGVLWEDETYAVSWLDVGENQSLYRRDAEGKPVIWRAGPKVVRVGSNADLVAFTVEDAGGRRDYAILKARDHVYASPKEVVIGPIENLPDFLAAHGAWGLRLEPL